ncbi:hypothetical protein HY640_02060, partial [Candidatus Woesearchaeota archaeon]|nr:hypothetical protein [Candidatus Woesearchaeota archaeon]
MLPINHSDLKFAVTVLESLNPFAYGHLRNRGFAAPFFYVLSLVFACLFFSAVLSLSFMQNAPGDVSRGFAKAGFPYELSGDSGGIDAFGVGVVFVGGKSNSHFLSVDDEGVHRNNLLCMSFSQACGFYSPASVAREDVNSLSSEGFSSVVRFLLVLSLPSLLAAALFLYTAKYVAVAVAVSLALLLASRLFRFKLNLNSSFCIASYSLTVVIAPELLGGGLGVE